jgi:hypothetical protein
MLKFKQFNDESAKCLNKLGDSANFFNIVQLPDSVKDGRWGGNQSVCDKVYYCRVQDFPLCKRCVMDKAVGMEAVQLTVYTKFSTGCPDIGYSALIYHTFLPSMGAEYS